MRPSPVFPEGLSPKKTNLRFSVTYFLFSFPRIDNTPALCAEHQLFAVVKDLILLLFHGLPAVFDGYVLVEAEIDTVARRVLHGLLPSSRHLKETHILSTFKAIRRVGVEPAILSRDAAYGGTIVGRVRNDGRVRRGRLLLVTSLLRLLVVLRNVWA